MKAWSNKYKVTLKGKERKAKLLEMKLKNVASPHLGFFRVPRRQEIDTLCSPQRLQRQKIEDFLPGVKKAKTNTDRLMKTAIFFENLHPSLT